MDLIFLSFFISTFTTAPSYKTSIHIALLGLFAARGIFILLAPMGPIVNCCSVPLPHSAHYCGLINPEMMKPQQRFLLKLSS